METIFTLNARDNCMLEVMADYLDLGYEAMHDEINNMFQDMVCTLTKKGLNYQELRACLTPSIDKKEVIYVFDSMLTNSSLYGNEIFNKIIPLLDKRTRAHFKSAVSR